MAEDKLTREEFYIGYLRESPRAYRSQMRKVVVVLAAACIAVALCVALGQREFSRAVFELGQQSEHTGVLIKSPVPMLQVDLGKGLAKNLLLIGFGKFGAESTIAHMEKDGPLDGKRITLTGTLIYGDGKTLLELTDGKGSLIRVEDAQKPLIQSTQHLGKATLQGEVIDPKCYFGVMKPGEGKTHRSCAARCLAGGIPPVLRTFNSDGQGNYFLLRNQNGGPFSEEAFPFVADLVQVTGSVQVVGDWYILKVDPESMKRL